MTAIQQGVNILTTNYMLLGSLGNYVLMDDFKMCILDSMIGDCIGSIAVD